MSEVICTALIGVVGTLAGTILGWILNNTSRRGKLLFFTSKWDESFEFNDTGIMTGAREYDKVEAYSYFLALDIYNSSSDTKVMRSLRMEFLKEGAVVVSSELTDADNSGSFSHRLMEALNIPPKSVVSIHMRGGFLHSELGSFDEINDSGKVRLAYKDEKNVDRYVAIDDVKGETRFDRFSRLRSRN